MYRLTNSVPYLLNRLGVRMGALFSRRIAPYGLSLPMYRVLAALSERRDQNLGELSEMTTVDLSTMSRLVGAMVKQGWVSRVRMPNNERTVRINLTVKGKELAGSLMQEAQHYEDVAISSLKSPVISKLKADLIQIYDALDLLEEELVERSTRVTPRIAQGTDTVASKPPKKQQPVPDPSLSRGQAEKGGRRSAARSSNGRAR